MLWITIPVSYERKYDTQKSNENYARKSRPCRLPLPQAWSVNSLISIFPILTVYDFYHWVYIDWITFQIRSLAIVNLLENIDVFLKLCIEQISEIPSNPCLPFAGSIYKTCMFQRPTRHRCSLVHCKSRGVAGTPKRCIITLIRCNGKINTVRV
jgi:hypothetical protein